VGLQPPKSLKLVIFGINLPKGVYPLKLFFYKIWVGEGQKCGLKPPKSQKNTNFWYIFSPKGYIRYAIFTKFGVGEGLPCTHNHANFHFCGFKNVALRPPKLPKIAIFGINLPLGGSLEKLEHRCTTRNLPLCNGTIIVLKISLVHSVSVMTNFVIPKRDKQTDKKITPFRLQPARESRPTIPTILGMVIEEDRTIFAPPPLTFLIRAIFSPLEAIE